MQSAREVLELSLVNAGIEDLGVVPIILAWR